MSPKKASPRQRGRKPAPRKAAGGRPSRAQAPAEVHGRRPFYTPGGSAFRHAIEQRSAPALMAMTQLPRPFIMFTPLALVLLGFFLPLAIGLVFLAIFLLFTSWLAYLSWPRAQGAARLVRLAMFTLVIALIVIRIVRA